jgi:endo-1,4-beta-xylanase
MKLSRILRVAFVPALVGTVLLSACIRRELPPEEPPSTETVPEHASPAPIPPSERPPTGLWGKVEGVDVLGGEGIRAFRVGGDPTMLEAKWLPVTGQPFNEKIRAKLLKPTKNAWDVQLRTSNVTKIEKGDALLATIYFRTDWVADESGEGLTEIVFELASDPWTKSVTYPTRAGSEWKKLSIPFLADGSFEPGDAQLALRMGYEKQTVEVAGVKLENFGKALALADLPRTRQSYPGQEPDAAWRADAQARIEQIRKEDLSVVVQDKSGSPIEGASVSVQMKRHAFYFGTAAPADLLVGDQNPKFKQVIPELFNVVTLENDLKWQPLAGDWGSSYTMERALKATEWLRSQDLAVRGHVLVWPGWQNLPAKLRKYEKDPARLKKEVELRIMEATAAMRGKVVDWDVVNEPFTNYDLLEILGYEVMVDWFKLARKGDPNAKLYINDFAILSGGGGNTAHRDHYEKMIKILVDGGAPLDGIGFQGHFGTALTGPADIYKLLERYGKFGKRFSVTEYDLLVEDEELAADFTRDFYTIMFSHAQVDSLIMWGFWDPRHWHKNSPVFRDDWSEKPAGKEFRRLTEQEWKTNEKGETNAEGAFDLRGFLGDYEITVTHGNKSQTVKTTLKKNAEGGAKVPVTVKL